MRIIIELDEQGEVTTRIERAVVPVETPEVESAPPPEVLRAAKKLGATSAGLAAIHRVARAAAVPMPSSLIETLPPARGDEDAGEAAAAPKAAARRPARPAKKRAAPKKKRAAAAKRKAPAKKRTAAKKRKR